jgi:hypothetical protein
MLTHRWWGNKFCKRTCKDAYLRELALGRDKICRWYGFVRGERFQTFLPARRKPVAIVAAVLPRGSETDSRCSWSPARARCPRGGGLG